MSYIHNFPKKANGLKPIQNLFDSNIDFETNTVPDNINGYNANLKYAYGIGDGSFYGYYGAAYAETTDVLDTQNDFTYTVQFTKGTYNRHFLLTSYPFVGGSFVLDYGTYGADRVTCYLSFTGIIFTTGSLNLVIGDKVIVSFIKNGNIYKIFVNGVLRASITNSVVLSTSPLGFNAHDQLFGGWLHFISNIKRALTDAEMLELGSDFDAYRNKAISESTISTFFYASEGTSLYLYDIIQGHTLRNSNTTSKSLQLVHRLYNLKYGFDLYTLDSNPATKLYIPLKYDGTSFNKVISGYTFVKTYTQSGNQFLPCGTKLVQPDLQVLKDVDVNNFYFSALGVPLEKSFENITAQTNEYIKYELVGGKINKLKLLSNSTINDYLLRYDFSNNLLDEKSIYNLTGVNTQLFVNDRNANLLSAYSSSTNSNYAYYPATTSLVGTGSFTISMWGYIDTNFLFVDNEGGGVGQWNTGATLNSNIFLLQLNKNDLKHGLAIETNTGLKYVISTNFLTNQWFHLVGVYDSVNNVIKIYLNGILDNSVSVTGTLLDIPNRRLYVNGLDNNNNPYVLVPPNQRYRFDDIRLYKRALTDAEILKLYNL